MASTIPADLGQRLHDRATRGESLSADEQVQLREWYALQDHAEAARLAVLVEPASRRARVAPVDLGQREASPHDADG